MRELPQQGYKPIVFRVHSGLLLSMEGDEVATLETTYLFTDETYSTGKYVTEQLTDKVSNAMMTEDYPLVFAVNSAFIGESGGSYDDAVIIAMGCESHYLDDLPAAFFEKGAAAYIGWSGVVGLEYVDEATLALLDRLCVQDMTLADAVRPWRNRDTTPISART